MKICDGLVKFKHDNRENSVFLRFRLVDRNVFPGNWLLQIDCPYDTASLTVKPLSSQSEVQGYMRQTGNKSVFTPKDNTLCIHVWQSFLQMWVWAYRKPDALFDVNTNNGIEAMHKTLKQTYIQKKGVCSITEVVEILTSQYLPDILRR